MVISPSVYHAFAILHLQQSSFFQISSHVSDAFLFGVLFSPQGAVQTAAHFYQSIEFLISIDRGAGNKRAQRPVLNSPVIFPIPFLTSPLCSCPAE
jgi:hypothetical protein